MAGFGLMISLEFYIMHIIILTNYESGEAPEVTLGTSCAS